MRGMLGNVFSLRGEVLWGVKEREEVIPNEDLGKGLKKNIYIYRLYFLCYTITTPYVYFFKLVN